MRADFNLIMDDDIFPIQGDFEDEFRGITESRECKFLSEWIKEVIVIKETRMRLAISKGEYDKARALEKYVCALEDVILLVREGITEALKKPEVE